MTTASFLPPTQRSMMGGFLTGIVAVLIFISGIALTTTASIGTLVSHWNASVSGTLTVQVPGASQTTKPKVDAILEALRKTPEIKHAELISADRMQALLKPWLGDEKLIADLPLPALIDVVLATPNTQSLAKAAAVITQIAPEAVIDDHRVWLNRIADFAQGLGYVAIALMVMAVGALVLTVVFATRASLTEYVSVIEVLHLVGARDRHIASQFSWRAMRQTLWGGALGLLAFAPALMTVIWLSRQIEASVLPQVALPVSYWVALAALPLIAGIISFVVALSTVRRALAAMV
jgi:cell division transport system permease protein